MKPFLYIAALLPGLSAAQSGPLTLEEALAQARQNRPTVRAAELRVREAVLSRRALSAFPATRAFLGYTTDPETGGSDEDAVLAQPIDAFGRTRASGALGRALVEQAEAEYRRTLAEVQSEVLEVYSEAIASAQLARVARSTEQIVEGLYSATQRRVEEGVMPGVQLTRLGIELERSRATRAQREAERNASLTRLTAATGISAPPSLPDTFASLPPLDVVEATLIAQRADLATLAAEARVAEAETRIARLGLLPELEVQARRTPWQDQSSTVGARIQLSLPIFDHGKTRSEAAAAQARARSRRLALEDATRIAMAEVAAVRTEVLAATDAIARHERIVQSAQLLVDRSRVGLTEGAVTMVEVLDSLRALREAEESLVESRHRLAQSQARHLRATGHLIGGSR